MRLQILSDLHLEFHPDGGREWLERIDFSRADAVVIAGDLCSAKGLLHSFELLFSQIHVPIVYVPGNHDYYGSSFDETEMLIQAAAKKFPQLQVLLNRSTEINGHRFIGCTLWFSEDSAMRPYERGLNDFLKIRGFQGQVYEKNRASMEFLARETQVGDIVVTHHLPSLLSVAAEYKASPLNGFFVCPMDDMIKKQKPTLWVHGHTHANVDYQLGKTRVVCNPFGYLGREENAGFEPVKLIEI